MDDDRMRAWVHWLHRVLETDAPVPPAFEVTDQIVDELVREIEAFLAEQQTERTDDESEEA